MANMCLFIYFTLCTKEASEFPFFVFFNTSRCCQKNIASGNPPELAMLLIYQSTKIVLLFLSCIFQKIKTMNKKYNKQLENIKRIILLFFAQQVSYMIVLFLMRAKNLLTSSHAHFRVNNTHSFSYDL